MWEAGTEGSIRLLKRSLAEHPFFTPPTSKFHRMVATCCEPKGQGVARVEAKGQGVPQSRAIHVGFICVVQSASG